MGPMINMNCEQWQGVIAMRVFGPLDPMEESGLKAHLEGCSECRAVAKEMKETYELLGYVDPRAVVPTASLPAELTKKVLEDLRQGDLQLRRRRRTRNAALTAIGFVAATIVLVSLLAVRTSPPTTSQHTLALWGASSVSAKAVLTGRAWGTTITLHEEGLPGGKVYTVSMRTAKGMWRVAGTYRPVSGHSVDVTMACAVPLGQITGVRVSDSSGRQVLVSHQE